MYTAYKQAYRHTKNLVGEESCLHEVANPALKTLINTAEGTEEIRGLIFITYDDSKLSRVFTPLMVEPSKQSTGKLPLGLIMTQNTGYYTYFRLLVLNSKVS